MTGSSQPDLDTRSRADSVRKRKTRSSVAYLDELQSRSSNSDPSPLGHSINVSVSVGGDAQQTARMPPSPSTALTAGSENTTGGMGHGLLDPVADQPSFGDSTCVGFSQQILQCLSSDNLPSPSPDYPYYRDSAFARQVKSTAACKLPDRIRAHLLVRVFLRFIGHDYHFFLERDFLRQLDNAYNVNATTCYDTVWACKFFVVLALGELYSTSAMPSSESSRHCQVPGVNYFITATDLLQDLYEDPSIGQIETLTLFCFYSNALGRIKSANNYIGIALRLSTSLGLHRLSSRGYSGLQPLDHQHRVRLWWTVYIFERTTSARLGLPAAIQDADINVEMPSSDNFSVDVQQQLGSPDHLIAHINLARITGLIKYDGCGPLNASSDKFVEHLRLVLQTLRKWDSHVPSNLRWSPGASRSVASLQLHFNQCIILATRPILLDALMAKVTGNPEPQAAQLPLTGTLETLAEACVSAARTSNTIFSYLFVENSIAVRGYFDAHHLFASTLVLIISTSISPNASDSDSVQTAFQLMKLMKENGNVAAANYLPRLQQIQAAFCRMMTSTPTTRQVGEVAQPISSSMQGDTAPLPMLSPTTEIDNHDRPNFGFFDTLTDASTGFFEPGRGRLSVDPLDNPLLEAFLDHAGSSGEGSLGSAVEGMDFLL
ncbi:transcriptional regulatory [Fusarium pseudoanthophilum]|uniref:Transcriptional regulatory n=1 Tax=Fusarium pseudoanthophilum TaxID=48495 RepID=A0A8H5KZ90_9HYPO|nr:transcriptional regulatory [Fusarium pseudoanthophilum]